MDFQYFAILINIILVGALVIITAYYAREVGKQTRLAEKDRWRNRILEEIQDVLTPTNYALEEEIKSITEKTIFWYKVGEGSIIEGLNKIYGNTYAFKDVFRKYPDLEKKFFSHDGLIGELNGLYTNIESEVRTDKLKNFVIISVDKFNQSKAQSNKLKWDYPEAERIIGNYIINKWNPKRSADTIQPNIDFWEENKDELLAFRTTSLINELDKKVDALLDQLKGFDGTILGEVKEKIERYREEYPFIKYDIDPKLKDFEEWLGLEP